MLGVALAALWLVVFGLIMLGYRPGGPVDFLVGFAAAGPIVVALAAVRWPPVARSPRAFAAMAWLALVPILLLVPSIAGLVTQLQGRGPQTLLPSAEAAYPWAMALFLTGVFAGLGIARRRLGDRAPRQRRLLAGVALGLVATLATGSAFSAAAVYNELSLGDKAAISSRFGPTDPTLEPPQCDGPLAAGATADLLLHIDSSVDGAMIGQATLTGSRNGTDVHWDGYVAGNRLFGRVGFVRVGGRAWDMPPNYGWVELPPGQGDGNDMDRQLVLEALGPSERKVVENDGLSYVEGARARHCRVAIDGPTLRKAIPEVSLLLGNADLSRWRGMLDFWVFADGQLGQADGVATGPALGLANHALSAALHFRLIAVDRGAPITVQAPG
jgi:hypothetical protein